jgi:hypothetical protein
VYEVVSGFLGNISRCTDSGIILNAMTLAPTWRLDGETDRLQYPRFPSSI